MDGTTITLGGERIVLRRLTVGQIRAISVLLEGARGAGPEGAGESFDRTVGIIAEGVRRARPDLTVEALLERETDLTELRAAQHAILQLGGYVQLGEEPAATPSTGPGSTGA